MALREELDNYNAEIVVGPEDDPQVTNAQLAVEEWNRTTVADGAWLQQNAIGPLSARDIVLANAIDDTNDALAELSGKMADVDGRSLKSINGRFFSGGSEIWQGSDPAIVPDGTGVKNDEVIYVPQNDGVILSMNDDAGHAHQLKIKENEIGYRYLAGTSTAEGQGNLPDAKYKYDTQAGNFRSLVMNATASGNFVVTSAGLQKLECDDVTIEINEDGKLALKDGPGIWFTSDDIIDKTGADQNDGFYHGSNYKLRSIYSNTIAHDCSGYTSDDTMYTYSYTDAIAYNSVFGGLSHEYLNAMNSSAYNSSLSLLMLDSSISRNASQNIVNATKSIVESCNYNILNVKDTEFKNAQSVLALADTSLNVEQNTIQSLNHTLLAVQDADISATYYALMIGEELTTRGGAAYSVLMGKEHTVVGDTKYNYINGVDNTLMNGAQYGMFVGSGNLVSGGVPNNIINGDENKVERSVSKNFILGNKNLLHDSVYHDIILGDENEAYNTSDNVIINGNKNSSHNTVIKSLIFGNENELQYGISACGVFGDGNLLENGVGYSLALGNNIEMSHRAAETYQKYAVGMGENIKVKGNYKHVAGDNTQAWNHYQLVLGKDAEDVAAASVLVGNHSKIAASYNDVAIGDHNFVSTSNSMTVGSHNLIMGPASMAVGEGLWTRNAGQLMIGQFAVSYVDSVLEIGMGSVNQTRTVFRIDKNGNVWITGELHCGNISAGSVTTGQSAPVMNGGVAYYNDAATWSAAGYSEAETWIAQ